MEKNVDHESKRDLLYVIVIIVLAIIYALLFTLDPLEKNYSQVMVMAILTGLLIIGQLPFIKRRIKRALYLSLILAIQIVIYLIIWMEQSCFQIKLVSLGSIVEYNPVLYHIAWPYIQIVIGQKLSLLIVNSLQNLPVIAKRQLILFFALFL